jgi:hypothetical protein
MSSEWSLDSVPVHQSQRTVHGWIDGYRGDASPTTSYPSTFDNSVWHNQNLSSSQVKVCSDRIEQIDKCRHSIRVLLKSELVPMNYSTVRQVIAQSGVYGSFKYFRIYRQHWDRSVVLSLLLIPLFIDRNDPCHLSQSGKIHSKTLQKLLVLSFSTLAKASEVF